MNTHSIATAALAALALSLATGTANAGQACFRKVASPALYQNVTESVLLEPPPPVADWPELTLVAARAVADAIGPDATIKHPNDVLVDGRKVAGILAEASERVVLGIGINVNSTAWPGAGWVERDRLELLVDVLERLERGYVQWLSR